MLVGSRSNAVRSDSFAGLKQVWHEGRLTNIRLNGPCIDFGMNAKRIFSWLVFELLVLGQMWNFRRFKPDVLIVSSLSVLTLLSGVILKLVLGCKLVVEIRDIYPLTLVEIGGFSKRHPLVILLGWIEHIGYRYADLVISPLEKCDQHVATILDNPPPFVWIPMGFDEALMSVPLTVAGSSVAKAIGETKRLGKFVIIYAGTVGVANAIEPLIEAAQLSEGSRLHFVCLGDGPLRSKFQAECAALTNISFYDPVPKSDVHHILSLCDLLLIPIQNKPIYRYGISPNKLIDYVLSGRPFITTLQADLEILRLYRSGFVAKSHNGLALVEKIEEVAAIPPSRLKEMGEIGRTSLYNNLSYASLAEKLVNALESIGRREHLETDTRI